MTATAPLIEPVPPIIDVPVDPVPPAPNPEDVFTALDRFINHRPGLRVTDYPSLHAYRTEINQLSRDRYAAITLLTLARNMNPAYPELLLAAFSTSGGQLRWHNGRLVYEPTGSELAYRQAAICVLTEYTNSWKREQYRFHPPHFTYSNLGDVKMANASIGGVWFAPKTMKCWGTTLASKLIAGKYFITSEKNAGRGRSHSIQMALSDGRIETIRTGYETAAKARKALKELLKGESTVSV